MTGRSLACQDHRWELRGVSFDLEIGALDEYECTRCPAVTFRQPSSGPAAVGARSADRVPDHPPAGADRLVEPTP